MRFFIEGVGLCGPGLDGWEASRAVLAGGVGYEPAATRVPQAALLPANERRRAVRSVNIALAAGAEAFAAAGREAAATATVFASSGGDGETIDQILNVLASPNRDISPTRFHNSVHNAPAGYWSIATGAQAPSSSLCAHDDSFAAGLLEAAAQLATEGRAVALIAYDICYPAPLSLVRPIGAAFGVALVLAPGPEAALACVELTLRPREAGTAGATVMAAPGLEALRRDTPAARCLPLLGALARGGAADITLDYLGDLAMSLVVAPV
jgi:hypothetical protein